MHRVVTISLLTPHSVSVFLMFIRAGLASPHLLIFIYLFFVVCFLSLLVKLGSHFCAVICQERGEINLPLSVGEKHISMSQSRSQGEERDCYTLED